MAAKKGCIYLLLNGAWNGLGGNIGISSAQTGDLTVVMHWDGGFLSSNQDERLCCSHLSSLQVPWKGVCEHLEGAGSTRVGTRTGTHGVLG